MTEQRRHEISHLTLEYMTQDESIAPILQMQMRDKVIRAVQAISISHQEASEYLQSYLMKSYDRTLDEKG